MKALFSSSKYESLHCLIVDHYCLFAFPIDYIVNQVDDIEEWYKTPICPEVVKIFKNEDVTHLDARYLSFYIYNDVFSGEDSIASMYHVINVFQKHKNMLHRGVVFFNCVECNILSFTPKAKGEKDLKYLKSGNGTSRLCFTCSHAQNSASNLFNTSVSNSLMDADNNSLEQKINLMHSVYIFCLKSVMLELRKEQCFSCFQREEKNTDHVSNIKHNAPGECEAALDVYKMFYLVKVGISQLSDELVHDIYTRCGIKWKLLTSDGNNDCTDILNMAKNSCGKLPSYKHQESFPETISDLESSDKDFILNVSQLDIYQNIPDMNDIRECYNQIKCKCRILCHSSSCTCIKQKIPCSVHCHTNIICDNRFDQPKRKFKFPKNDILILKSPTGCLTDNHMFMANSVLRRDHPLIGGLQDTLHQTKMSWDMTKGEFVQFLLIKDNHWITISNIGILDNAVNVYDSSYSKMNSSTKTLICNYCKNKKIRINVMNVQQQKNGSDCGVFAIAFAKSLLLGEDPTNLIFCQPRNHLYYFLPQRLIPKFPSYYAPCAVKVLETVTLTH